MGQDTTKLNIPFETLVRSLSALRLEDKRRILEVLDEQIAQTEESLLEQSSVVRGEIQEAREAYRKGDYVTIDEYLEKKHDGK